MAVHTLVTGVPGAGKTLYTLWELVRPMVGQVIPGEDGAPDIPRRVIVGNVRDLLLDHEVMAVPAVDPETWREPHGELDRQPGEPALEVPYSVDTWWLWCRPGDVIVVDECQRAFRPMPAGRRVPRYIARLETARHYGVEFIFVTQHPQLLHTNVRNLVGRHLHVRRLFAGVQTVVYEWDHCTHPDRIKNATAVPWRHKSSAFGLYKSAEVHTKGRARIPLAMFLLASMLVVVPVVFWWAGTRLFGDKARPPVVASADPAASSASAGVDPPAASASAVRAAYVAPDAGPGFVGVIKQRQYWPENIAGCWTQAGDCTCVTQGEYPERLIRDRPALCLAVVLGDLVAPPDRRRRPERTEPTVGAHGDWGGPAVVPEAAIEPAPVARPAGLV